MDGGGGAFDDGDVAAGDLAIWHYSGASRVYAVCMCARDVARRRCVRRARRVQWPAVLRASQRPYVVCTQRACVRERCVAVTAARPRPSTE